jgi:hypothetical protein
MPFPLIPLILAGASAASQAQGGRQDAGMLRLQGRVARSQAKAEGDVIGRDLRQIMGSQAASIAQNGGGYGGTNSRLLQQTEVLGNLDRLKALYRGNLRAKGLSVAADATMAKAYQGAATTLLSAGSKGYSSANSVPGFG